jgi:hypothetical protein
MTVLVILATWLGVALTSVVMILVFALGGTRHDR